MNAFFPLADKGEEENQGTLEGVNVIIHQAARLGRENYFHPLEP